MSKKVLILTLLVFMLMISGCGGSDTAATNDENQVPTLNVGYIFTNHQTPLMVAANKGEAFSSNGTYLKPIVEREKYELIADGEKVANINLVVNKSGSETTTLFAQKHLDLALGSITAMITGVDTDVPIKVISPLQTEGMALIFPQDSAINNWDEFLTLVKESDQPVKIGYHSPTSAPKFVLEGALDAAGLKITGDATDMSADILLVDLKETSNLIPALQSKQVDGWVGPSPFPEVAVTEGVGKVIIELRDLPPEGHWHDFPCCVLAARDEIIASNPKEVQAFANLITEASKWCNENKEEAAIITANWIGIPEEAAKASTLNYTTDPSENWLRGAGIHVETLGALDKLSGKLNGKNFADVESELFDFQFVD
ncbi:ABC transporter substrate-binding protein [Peptococcaceae bacterium 1198_IL3148]